MGRQFAGIDIGSRSIELVVIDETGQVTEQFETDTTNHPMEQARSLLDRVSYDIVTATGYGRNLFEISFEAATVTEIKAHARGAKEQFPEICTVLDIGGQDSKVIAMGKGGKVLKFEMNDRCAAGTGKFMEIMATTLGYSIDAFGREAMAAESEITISSMCTVFAESEVTSLIARGNDSREIALGLHQSVVRRVSGMLNRVSSSGDFVFTGGVARNPCMVSLLEDSLERKIFIPEKPQFTGALGAALIAKDSHKE